MTEQPRPIDATPPVIRKDCPLEGHEGEYVLFKRKGWKFKHLRLWETLPSTEEVVELVIERIHDWHLTDEDGNIVPFQPTRKVGEEEEKAEPNVEALDDLPPDVAAWVVTAFRMAYQEAGLPSPNS